MLQKVAKKSSERKRAPNSHWNLEEKKTNLAFSRLLNKNKPKEMEKWQPEKRKNRLEKTKTVTRNPSSQKETSTQGENARYKTRSKREVLGELCGTIGC